MISSKGVKLVAQEVLRWPDNRKWNSKEKDQRFRGCFSASSVVVADIWNKIQRNGKIETGGRLKHLLWALVHLKVYTRV